MATMTVLGGTGQMGALAQELLTARGHTVRQASRATGVDVETGRGLVEAIEGAEVVLDCLNRQSQRRKVAVSFFAGAATRVARATGDAGVKHVVVLSIVNVTEPAARRFTGYYAGKAAQEEVYAQSCPVPVTVVETTAWFTLARTFLDLLAVGPVRPVPSMMLQPVHPAAAAELLADVCEQDPPTEDADGQAFRRIQLAGPEPLSTVQMAQGLATAEGASGTIVPVPLPGGIRRVLLPGPQARIDQRRYADWLTEQR